MSKPIKKFRELDVDDFKSKSELVKMFIDNTPIAYIILDSDYRIHYINESFAKLRKLDLVSTIGQRCFNISNGGVRCANCAVAEALATGEKAFVSRKDVLPDGSVRFIDDYAIPLQKDSEGAVEYILEIMINRTQEMLAREQRNIDYDEILSILASLLDAKDSYTAAHSESVRRLSLNIARAMGLSLEEIFEVTVAASLHDIGKVRVPNEIINKPGKLTDDEFSVIKSHPSTSYDMLSGLSSFDNIRSIARHHHERVDGRGYPDRLTDGELSIGAKIVAVADTYDAMTSTRSYRKALPHEVALEEIKRVSGTQLDKDVVEAFANMDFDNMIDSLYAEPEQFKQVERVLKQSEPAETHVHNETFCIEDNQERLMNEIFNNTPCGYILMDKNRNVLYASDYFLSYMGLTKDDVLGKICYEAGGIGSRPCENCSIERALKSGKTEYMRQEQFTSSGRKIFDLFGVPLVEADGSIEYVIEIVIDRTEEVQLERSREQDFIKLIEMLGRILDDQKDSINEQRLSEEILSLRKRLNKLIKKKIL